MTLYEIYQKYHEGQDRPEVVYMQQTAFLDMLGWKRMRRSGWYCKGTTRARRVAALRLEGVDVQDPAGTIVMTKKRMVAC